MLAPVDDVRIKMLELKVDALERELKKRPTLEEIEKYLTSKILKSI